MASFDISNQASGTISTPSSGNTTLFVDSGDKLLKSKDDAGVVTNYGAPGTAITSLTGEVTASGPGAAAATVTNSAVLSKVLTGLVPSAGTVVATDTILQAFNKLALNQSCAWFGNGSDGDVVIAVDTTLTRDMYYNTLTVNLGATLFTAGFKVHVLGDATISGIIDRSGTDATGTAAVPGLVAGTLGSSGAGGAGGAAAGAAGGATTNASGGAGGLGGTGSGGAGGAGGTATVPTAALGGIEVLNAARQAAVCQNTAGTILPGGAGGGGGGGDGTAGGAGGSGGGVILVAARNLTGTGTLRAKGGNGFQPVAGNRGGGAGGGGGAIVLITENDTTSTSLTFTVSGGTGASGFGTGTSGANGSNGRVVRIRS